MGNQIIKQPNGKYALWSSIVTDFVLYDATPADIIQHMVENERKDIERAVKHRVALIDRGEPAYFQFTMSWEQACATAKDYHGRKWKLPKGVDLPTGPAAPRPVLDATCDRCGAPKLKALNCACGARA